MEVAKHSTRISLVWLQWVGNGASTQKMTDVIEANNNANRLFSFFLYITSFNSIPLVGTE